MIATSREEARCGNGVDDTKAEWIPRWRRSPTPLQARRMSNQTGCAIAKRVWSCGWVRQPP